MPLGQSPSVRVPTSGYFVQAAYLITGETIRERTVIDPINRFDLRPGKFGLGAFEPHVRYSEMFLGRQVFTAGLADPNLWTNRVQMVDVGVNWYLNKFVKIYFDWEHAMFASPVFAAVRPSGRAAFQSVNGSAPFQGRGCTAEMLRGLLHDGGGSRRVRPIINGRVSHGCPMRRG